MPHPHPSVAAPTSLVRRVISMVVGLALIAVPVAGCGDGAPATPDAAEPASVSHRTADGDAVSWEVATAGHAPGSELSARVAMLAGPEGPWSGRVCLALVSTESVVARSEGRPFSLAGEAGERFAVGLRIPEDLPEGTYGLALVVEESAPANATHQTLSVTIGEGGGEPQPTGRWAMPSCE